MRGIEWVTVWMRGKECVTVDERHRVLTVWMRGIEYVTVWMRGIEW